MAKKLTSKGAAQGARGLSANRGARIGKGAMGKKLANFNVQGLERYGTNKRQAARAALAKISKGQRAGLKAGDTALGRSKSRRMLVLKLAKMGAG